MVKRQHKNWNKSLSIFLSFLIFMSATITLSAWNDNQQHKSNEFSGNSIPQTVVLTKFEKDSDGNETNNILEGAIFRLFKDGNPVEQIGLEYTTNKNGQIMVNDLESGTYYFEEVRAPEGYDFDYDEDHKIIKKYPFEIKGNESSAVPVKAFNRRFAGELVIKKELVNRDDTALSDAQQLIDFEFEVTFNDGGTYQYRINNGVVKTLVSGETILLKHGEQAVFKNLPKGLKYSVRELYSGKYVSSSVNDIGVIEHNQKPVVFTNTLEKKTNLEFKKVVKNSDGSVLSQEQLTELNDIFFSFVVTFKKDDHVLDFPFHYTIDGGEEIRIMSGEIISIKHDQVVQFTDVPSNIEYRIFENPMPLYLPVIDEFDGVTIEGHTQSYVFENIFEIAPEDDLGSLKFAKTIVGDIDGDKLFEFEVVFSRRNHEGNLELDDTNYMMSINGGNDVPIREQDAFKNIIHLKHGDVVVIKDIPKNVHYRIQEKEETGYQAATYETSGVIVGNVESFFMFENIREKDVEDKGQLIIRKEVQGITTNQDFNFTLTLNDEEYRFTLKDGERKIVEAAVGSSYHLAEEDYSDDGYQLTMNNANGVLSKDTTIDILAINKYVKPELIKIKGEKTWDLKGHSDAVLPDSITVNLYDGVVKVASKSVFPDSFGKWNYEFDVPHYDHEGNEINYTVIEQPLKGFKSETKGYNLKNTYVENAKTDLMVTKRLINPNDYQVNELFTFEINSVNHSPLPHQKTITVINEGTASFNGFEFFKPGSYRYKIYEHHELNDYLEYDDTVYDVTFTVIEVQESLEVIDTRIIESTSNEHVDRVEFKNVVIAQPTVPPINPKPKPPIKPEKPPITENTKPNVVAEGPDTSVRTNKDGYIISIVINTVFLMIVLLYNVDQNKKKIKSGCHENNAKG